VIDTDEGLVKDHMLLKKIVNLALDKKAKDLVILDVRGISSITDFMVICHGNSEPQVKAITDNIRKGTPQKPKYLEGYDKQNWVLIDYFDVIIHVFNREQREYYSLERLWADAPYEKINNE
jgi:ribosome-associated protein